MYPKQAHRLQQMGGLCRRNRPASKGANLMRGYVMIDRLSGANALQKRNQSAPGPRRTPKSTGLPVANPNKTLRRKGRPAESLSLTPTRKGRPAANPSPSGRKRRRKPPRANERNVTALRAGLMPINRRSAARLPKLHQTGRLHQKNVPPTRPSGSCPRTNGVRSKAVDQTRNPAESRPKRLGERVCPPRLSE